jgi:serine/threonine protein kinase
MAYDPLIGATLGSYQVIEAVGEGGMARIYRGVHAHLERDVAIKVVNWGLQEDPEFTERFRREAQAIATLRHSNIVQIFDFGKHDNGYYMVMEFIDGGDLAGFLEQYSTDRDLPPKDEVIRLVKGVAAALDYAHSQNVIHRDIKPSNIMLTSDGEPILTDFGLVMLPAQSSKVTLGNTFGTPHYIAPEQAISSAAAVPASDVYSLGVIIFEMLTGELPFDDESPLSIALKHVSDSPPMPSSINPDISPDVEKVILKSLAKDHADRFATANDLALALEAAWSGTLGHFDAPLFPPRTAPATIPVPIIIPPPPATQISDHALPVMATHQTKPNEAVPLTERVKSSTSVGALLGAVILGAILVLLPILLLSDFFEPKEETPTSTLPAQVANDTGSNFTLPTDTPTTIPTITPTETPMPTDTFTPEPTDTFTPEPTDTFTPEPTETFTPEPTDTPVPIPTAIPIIVPEPTKDGPLTREKLRGKILFKTNRDESTAIYRMEPDGSNQIPLPREAWNIYSELEASLPFSSQSQEQVVPKGDGQFDLWLINLADGSELRVTSTAGNEYDAAWSPVNRLVAYVSEDTGRGDIYTINLGGSANERLTISDSVDKHPSWSPDGKEIAFWSDRGALANRQIWVIDLDTRVIRSLSDNPFEDYDPVWVR